MLHQSTKVNRERKRKLTNDLSMVGKQIFFQVITNKGHVTLSGECRNFSRSAITFHCYAILKCNKWVSMKIVLKISLHSLLHTNFKHGKDLKSLKTMCYLHKMGGEVITENGGKKKKVLISLTSSPPEQLKPYIM